MTERQVNGSMMTIDGEITQEIELYEIAKDRYKTLGLENCKRFAEEHKQYVEQLKELKRLRENANSYNKEEKCGIAP